MGLHDPEAENMIQDDNAKSAITKADLSEDIVDVCGILLLRQHRHRTNSTSRDHSR